ncbi:MAG: hypothetical protein KAW17_04855 [Candidatus Eisenbacteria sp.]|nr:hypothetical protein [Candidatus Eisenbacteria bacterium]
MTKRLYQIDSYRTTFESVVLRRFPEGEKVGIVLAETCFYPTSGGQYADHGNLGGVPIVDVRLDNDDIVHVLPSDPGGDRMVGEIDWTRRFDHMQQHSGQHVLSQSFLRILNLNTVSAHLGSEVSTIELPADKISQGELDDVENEANRTVLECRAIRTVEMTSEKARSAGLRRASQRQGILRVVEVDGYDLTACGGTHCRSTGEIGPIRIGRTERIRKQTRVEFLCGWRALGDCRKHWMWLEEMSRDLGRKPEDVPGEMKRLSAEVSRSRKRLGELEKRVLKWQARELLEGARVSGEVRVVEHLQRDISPDGLAALAGYLVSGSSVVALLGLRAETGYLVAARSEDVDLDVNEILKAVLARRSGRGGGTSRIARGGMNLKDLDAALRDLGESVEAALGAGS